MIPQLIIIGAGGHARVLAEIAKLSAQYLLIGFTDPEPELKGQKIMNSPVLGTDEILPELRAQGVETAIIGVGSVGHNGTRMSLFEKVLEIGFCPAVLVHPTAVISSAVRMGRGIAVMANAVVNPGAMLGDNVIVNSGVIIEHGCIIGEHVHIASGARLASGVQVGSGSHIGVGASVIQSINIGRGSIIGAGSVVVRDIPDYVVSYGVPARIVKNR